MGLKKYRPTSPGRRSRISPTFEEITKKKPEGALLLPLKKKGGRNIQGRITVRHRAGGAKRRLRIIDFKRDKLGIPGKVAAVEYDPNRSARIALIHYVDGEKRYIIAPSDLKVGDYIKSGGDAEIKPGNALPLRLIPTGILIHNIELEPGGGAKLVRSAGGVARLMGRENGYVLVQMPSGEMRRIHGDCLATIGQVGNIDHQNIVLGKAGASRWLGRRPGVRASAMSPRDHPHGGGEGRSPIGMPGPKTPWGKPTLGYRTRRRKLTDRMIVKPRGKN